MENSDYELQNLSPLLKEKTLQELVPTTNSFPDAVDALDKLMFDNPGIRRIDVNVGLYIPPSAFLIRDLVRIFNNKVDSLKNGLSPQNPEYQRFVAWVMWMNNSLHPKIDANSRFSRVLGQYLLPDHQILEKRDGWQQAFFNQEIEMLRVICSRSGKSLPLNMLHYHYEKSYNLEQWQTDQLVELYRPNDHDLVADVLVDQINQTTISKNNFVPYVSGFESYQKVLEYCQRAKS